MIIAELLKSILNNQTSHSDFLPKLNYHVEPHLISYENGYLVFTLKLEGIPFESTPNNHLNAQATQFNLLLTSLGKTAGNRLALWATVMRKKRSFKRSFAFDNIFTQQFAKKYLARFENNHYFSNHFYLSGILKTDNIEEGIKEANDILAMLNAGLAPYQPRVLRTYHNENGVVLSEMAEFFATLINYDTEPIPVCETAFSQSIGNADLHFGTDVCEIRTPNNTIFATCFDLRDFGISRPKALVDILDLPFEFTLTQSFVFIDNNMMLSRMTKQLTNLVASGDRAEHQQAELDQGRGLVTAGELMFGDYSASLIVYGQDPVQASNNGAKAVSRFLNAGGFRFTRAGLSAPATYFSQVPNSKLRPRTFPKTTQNLASTFGMHNYSTGKETGNPIGDGSAVIPLMTVSNTIYDFNFHFSNLDENNLGDKVAGHTLILGATGTGKTTLETSLLAFVDRFNPSLFVMDLDQGMRIFIHAIGGKYFSLENGKPTGLNPFQLEDTPKNREFLYSLVATCGQNAHGKISANEERQIKFAVDSIFGLDFEHRRFSRLMDSIPYEHENEDALRVRLQKWCESENGRFAWCLDNAQNQFNPEDFSKIGFDLTAILQDNYPPTEPVLMYLFHLRDLMMAKVAKQNGILCTVVEEFWYPLRYKKTAELMLKMLKTDRKLGGWVLLTSQSPEDAIQSEIFPAIVQQTPTKIFLPNPDGKFEGSYEHCGITHKEFSELVKLSLDSRTFLVKQSKHSAFAKLDLAGFSDEIAVLSGNSANNEILDQVMQEHISDDPAFWYPIFQNRLCEHKAQKQLHKES